MRNVETLRVTAMIATSPRNGQQHTPPQTLTAEQCLRVLVKQMLKERGLRAVLKIVKEEFGYPLEIQYKV